PALDRVENLVVVRRPPVAADGDDAVAVVFLRHGASTPEAGLCYQTGRVGRSPTAPTGRRPGEGATMPRFVILEHDWPTRHWDLLLEAGGVLRAWRLLDEPVPGTPVPAEPNADHRLFYLDYEGPVSGGRGNVSRWAAGVFDWIEDNPGR